MPALLFQAWRRLCAQSLMVVLVAAGAYAVTTRAIASDSKCDVVRIARDFIAERYPSFDASGLKPIVAERGNEWELTFELPNHMLGGVPVVTIDKRTCKVVRAFHTQ